MFHLNLHVVFTPNYKKKIFVSYISDSSERRDGKSKTTACMRFSRKQTKKIKYMKNYFLGLNL